MGTRGLLGLIIAAQRHAAYNHFDSYPSGLGQDIVRFILSLKPEEITAMAARVREITWVRQDLAPSAELQKYYDELGFANLTVSNQILSDWYCLLHKVQGAATLPEILNGKLKHLEERVDFQTDGLFCEWSYFIDFETEKLETYANGTRLIGSISFKDLRVEGASYMEKMEIAGSEDEEA